MNKRRVGDVEALLDTQNEYKFVFERPERKICYSLDGRFVGESIILNESLRHRVS